MKKKIIVSALSLAIGAGLAGSITSTAAWYQYSTKVQAAVVGVAGGVKGNLQMRIRADGQQWTTRINKDDMADYIGAKKLVPLTSGQMDRKDNLPTLYCNPVYGYEEQSSWKQAVADNYITIPLELRYRESSDTTSQNLAKDIYLSDLFIAQDEADDDHEDISSAIRFYVAAYSQAEANPEKVQRLISKDGGTINTHGYLDLDGDGEDDRKYDNKSDKYGFTNGTGEKISYGGTTSVQTAYAAKVTSAPALPMIADIANGVTDGDRKLGTTLTNEDKFLSIDITIWFEGWQPLQYGSNSDKTIWDATKYINSQFDIGFEFEATDAQ